MGRTCCWRLSWISPGNRALVIAPHLLSFAAVLRVSIRPAVRSCRSEMAQHRAESRRSTQAIAGSAQRPLEYYFGATAADCEKAANGGVTWFPVTDGQLRSSSAGADLSIDPKILACRSHPAPPGEYAILPIANIITKTKALTVRRDQRLTDVAHMVRLRRSLIRSSRSSSVQAHTARQQRHNSYFRDPQ
jgi:hypothetical protein